MHQNESAGAGFGLGIVAGVVVGAGLALLFAPKAGTELRGELGQSVDTLRDAVTRRYRDVATRAGVEIGNLQANVERATDAVESIAQQAIETAAQRVRTSVGPRA